LGEFVWSSRRRHTRLISDWSSDVCSSDLLDDKARGQGDNCGELDYQKNVARARFNVVIDFTGIARLLARAGDCGPMQPIRAVLRSEERRVGKDSRCRWSADGGRGRGERKR